MHAPCLPARVLQPLPADLLPYMRLVHAGTAEELEAVHFGEQAAPVGSAIEAALLGQLIARLRQRLTMWVGGGMGCMLCLCSTASGQLSCHNSLLVPCWWH